MQRPLVSILIVCHNDWPDLELAVESALCQSYPRCEVIVVDNGSTDETQARMEALGQRIVYIRQANSGAAGGRNAGLRVCCGEYIQFLDGDDVLAPNKIEKQVEFLEGNPEVDIALGRFRCFRSTTDVPPWELIDDDCELSRDVKASIIERCPGPPVAMLMRRRVFERIGFQDPKIHMEDYDYWLRAAFADCQFGSTPGAWSFYRRRRGQKSQAFRRFCRSDLRMFHKALEYVDEEPYRALIHSRLARVWRAFAHDYLYQGKRRRARAALRKAGRHCPEGLDHRGQRSALLAHVPAGDVVYRWMRRIRRLPPPFERTAASGAVKRTKAAV